MPENEPRSLAHPAGVFGLTCLIIGLTFALPFRVVPESELKAASDSWSNEVGNMYAFTAWAGWAHFVFAFKGQGNALTKIRDHYRAGRLAVYVACIVLTVAALFLVRQAMGVTLFGGVVWLYFIDHFLKAEQLFEGRKPDLRRWLSSAQPLITFAWLSIVLLNVGKVTAYPWLLWSVSLVVGASVLIFGGWHKLMTGDVRAPLLSLFFVAEALVWGTISRFGESVFLSGVYVFHIAAGSYMHYLGSYFFAASKLDSRAKAKALGSILAVNVVIIALGCLCANVQAMSWLSPVLGIQWFTLWVGVHLVASDLFPAIKTWRVQAKA